MKKSNLRKGPKKIIPELYETEEPEAPTREVKTLEELKRIEDADAKEDAKADSLDLDEGVNEMTPAEMAAFKAGRPAPTKASVAPVPKIQPTIQTPAGKQTNLITKERALIYTRPTIEQWKQLHEVKPVKLIFYYTVTKEEYKEYFLMQVKYGTKISASVGGRVI